MESTRSTWTVKIVRDAHRVISVEKIVSFEMQLHTSSVLDVVCHVLFSLFGLSGKHNQAHALFDSLSRPADLGHRSCHF